MNVRFGWLLLCGGLLLSGCAKSEPVASAPAPPRAAEAPAPPDAPAAPSAPAAPADVLAPMPPPDAPVANVPAANADATDAATEVKPATPARPSLLIKLLAKPVNDAVQQATDSLPAPSLGGGLP